MTLLARGLRGRGLHPRCDALGRADCTRDLMPELPDITVYVRCLEQRVVGEPLIAIRLGGPVVLRTVDPPIHWWERSRWMRPTTQNRPSRNATKL